MKKRGVAQDFGTVLWKLRVTECLSSSCSPCGAAFMIPVSGGSVPWVGLREQKGPAKPWRHSHWPIWSSGRQGSAKDAETKAFHRHPSSTRGWQITQCLLKVGTVQGSHVLCRRHILLWDVVSSGSNDRGQSLQLQIYEESRMSGSLPAAVLCII